jgi:hypothetical protein
LLYSIKVTATRQRVKFRLAKRHNKVLVLIN